MTIGISFAMRITRLRRHKFIQGLDNIAPHRRIGIFINGQTSSGVRAEDETYAVLNFALRDHGLNFIRNLN